MNRSFGLLFCLLAVACASTPPSSPSPKALPVSPPPATRRDAVSETLHGVEVKDPYRWLEDEKAPEVQSWMKAQDAHARKALQALPGREALVKRFKALFYVDSVLAPVKRGQRYFYIRTHREKEKAVLYWREGEKGEERVLLDPNKWSADGTVSLGVWMPSPDGKWLAFSQKPNAADEAILRVVEVATGKWSEVDIIEGAKYAGPNWTPDSKAFYYEWLPIDPSISVAERPGFTEIRLHTLGKSPTTDTVEYPATADPRTFLRVSLSRDGKYLFAYVIRGWSENDIYWKRVGVDADWRLLIAGKDATYGVQAWKDQLYILSNEGAGRQRVFKTPVTQPERAKWKVIVPEDPVASLESVDIVGERLSLRYLRNAATELRVASLEGEPLRTVVLPELGTTSDVVGNEDEDDAYFVFSSFLTPAQVYRTSMATGKVDVWAQVSLPIDPSRFVVEQRFATSKDGTRVPLFVVHAKGLRKDGSHPTLLYGYGGFNISLSPSFKSSIYPWLEAGGVYVVANLRGGGEFGKAWHDAGRLHAKQNVFDDFRAAAELLVKEGYTKPSRLGISGGSNGGLLVGAAMTQWPELLGAVVCAVPLLDMVRFHQFGSGQTWVPEYGSSEDPEDFKVLYGYSPYHQVKAGKTYPPLLMLSADHDDRVDPLHARKFVAAVQHASPSSLSLLRIESNAGHGGADRVALAIESQADVYAFLFQQLGL